MRLSTFQACEKIATVNGCDNVTALSAARWKGGVVGSDDVKARPFLNPLKMVGEIWGWLYG